MSAQTVSTFEAAKYLIVSYDKVRSYCATGKLRARKDHRGIWHISVKSLDKLGATMRYGGDTYAQWRRAKEAREKALGAALDALRPSAATLMAVADDKSQPAGVRVAAASYLRRATPTGSFATQMTAAEIKQAIDSLTEAGR